MRADLAKNIYTLPGPFLCEPEKSPIWKRFRVTRGVWVLCFSCEWAQLWSKSSCKSSAPRSRSRPSQPRPPGRWKKINRSHTHTPTENNTPDTHTRQEQRPKPPNEHLSQTLNNARRWRDDGACHLPCPGWRCEWAQLWIERRCESSAQQKSLIAASPTCEVEVWMSTAVNRTQLWILSAAEVAHRSPTCKKGNRSHTHKTQQEQHQTHDTTRRTPQTITRRRTPSPTCEPNGGVRILRGEYEYGYSWGRPKWNIISYYRGYSMIFHL